ncbi:MAG TPA: ribonuclease P protein component [Thermodesulfobacteriota bacterium]|nr:ribonuclease P protein component [Thermodesulfobacteriota bacterium]
MGGSERPGRADFPKAARLLHRRDFDRVSQHGTVGFSRHFKVVASLSARDAGGRPRLGLIVPRAVGGAVARNRVKRLVREWFRQAQASFPPELDVVVIARRGAARLTLAETARELAGATRWRLRGERR